MSDKTKVMILTTIGSIIGSYLPTFFGVSPFSYTSVLLGGVGGCIGLYIGYRLVNG